MMDMMNYNHGGWMGGMWFFPLLFWILVIVSTVFIIRWLRERGESQQESSLDILKRRYASGEIDRDTFEQMRKDIEKNKS